MSDDKKVPLDELSVELPPPELRGEYHAIRFRTVGQAVEEDYQAGRIDAEARDRSLALLGVWGGKAALTWRGRTVLFEPPSPAELFGLDPGSFTYVTGDDVRPDHVVGEE